MALHRPGKPQQTFCRKLDGRLRDECLNDISSEACQRPGHFISQAWRVDYNTCRPHTSLGGSPRTRLQPGPDRTRTRTDLWL